MTINLYKRLKLSYGLGVLLLCAWWLVTAPPVRAAGPTCTVGTSGADYTTIQAAVNDYDCGTINIAAGTYTENVSISRMVTINGATNGSTIVDGNNSGSVFSLRSLRPTITLNRLTIQHGFASEGGGIYANGPILTLLNSTIRENRADYDGGGIFSFISDLTIVNSTIANNIARSGGGLSLESANVALIASTIATNSTNYGETVIGYAGTITLRNTIIGGGCRSGPYGVFVDGGHNLDGGGNCNVGPVTDPKVDPKGLQNNGGATATIALLAGSPAIDAGDDSVCNAAPVSGIDQRGVAHPKGAHCDIGAYEADPIVPPIVTVSFIPTGQHGWFTTNPAIGRVTALGLASITDIQCNNALVSDLTGLGTASASATVSVNAEGSLTIVTCTATDSTGQTGAAAGSSNQAAIWLDSLAPDTTLTAQPTNPSTAPTASFGFSGTDNATPQFLRYQCQLDSDSWRDCTSPQSYSDLSDGPHTFQVQAIDQAGNVDATPASYSWTVDATAPSVTINQAAGQADPTSSNLVHFTVVFNEAVTDFTASDVTLSGTAGATTATVTGSGTTYDVAVSGMTNAGTVLASIAANVASDALGNGNLAATTTDDTVTFIAADTTVQIGKSRTALTFDRTANGVATLGTYTLVFDYVNNTGHSLRNVYYQVTAANNAYLMNADNAPGQVGAQQSVPNSGLTGGDNLWQAGETLSGQTHLVGVAGKAWSLTLAIYALDATLRSGEPQLIDTLTFDSAQFSEQGQTIFLPLISR